MNIVIHLSMGFGRQATSPAVLQATEKKEKERGSCRKKKEA